MSIENAEVLYQRGIDLYHRGKAPSRLYRKKGFLEPAWIVEQEARQIEALDCFERASKLGHPGGKYEFAILLLEKRFPINEAVSKKYSNEAVDLILEAAEQGHRDAAIRVAMVELGYSLHEDNVAYRRIHPDPQNAIKRLEQCIPHETALSILCQVFELGTGVPKDLSKALAYEFLRMSLCPNTVGRTTFSPSRIANLKLRMTETEIYMARAMAERNAGKHYQYIPIVSL